MTIEIYNPKTDKTIAMQGDEIQIMGQDGRSLYNLRICDNGTLEVSTHITAKAKGSNAILDTSLNIMPKAYNSVTVQRQIYKDSD